MACNPTRLELSNTDATTVDITITSDPGDGTAVVLEVPDLGISGSADTVSGQVSFGIVAQSAIRTNSLWDGTIQVGSNAPADIVVQIVETSAAQTVGVTITDSSVTYCAPLSGGAQSLADLSDVTWGAYDFPNPTNANVLKYNSSQGTWSNDLVKQSATVIDQTLGENNTDVTIFGFGGTQYPANGQVLTWSTSLLQWTNLVLTIDADQITSGTIDNARISLAIDDLTDCTVDKTADNILYTNGSAVRSRAASNWALSQFTNDLVLNDLTDVNVAQGAGNDGDLVYYDHAAGAGAKFKGAARSSIGLTEFNNDLSDSYLMLIESPTAGKTYTLDGRAATARTITNFYAKTASGTATAVLKNLTDATTIGSIAATTTGASAGSLSNTAVDENDRLGIQISIASATEDLELVVEYTG